MIWSFHSPNAIMSADPRHCKIFYILMEKVMIVAWRNSQRNALVLSGTVSDATILCIAYKQAYHECLTYILRYCGTHLHHR